MHSQAARLLLLAASCASTLFVTATHLPPQAGAYKFDQKLLNLKASSAIKRVMEAQALAHARSLAGSEPLIRIEQNKDPWWNAEPDFAAFGDYTDYVEPSATPSVAPSPSASASNTTSPWWTDDDDYETYDTYSEFEPSATATPSASASASASPWWIDDDKTQATMTASAIPSVSPSSTAPWWTEDDDEPSPEPTPSNSVAPTPSSSAPPTVLPEASPSSTPLAGEPTAVGALFSSLGTQVFVSFDMNTDQGGMYGQFDCSELLSVDESEDTEAPSFEMLLGMGSFCFWKAADELAITLGSFTEMEPGVQIRILSGKIGRAGHSRSRTAYGVVTVGVPEDMASPIVVVSAPETIGSCSDLVLDATMSSGSLGGPFAMVQWELLAATDSSGEVDAPAVAAALEGANESESLRVVISGDTLTPGVTYHFFLALVNVVGLQGFTEDAISVTVADAPLPSLTVLTGTRVEARRENPLKIKAAGSIECGDITDLQFSFTQLSGPTDVSDAMIISGRTLLIPAGNLFVDDATYEFGVAVSIGGEASLTTTATVTVSVAPMDVLAIIKGGDRAVSTASPVILDASQSMDPNSVALTSGGPSRSYAETFQWTCTDESGVDCSASIADPSSKVTSIQTGLAFSGMLTITLTYTADEEEAVAQVTLSFSAAVLPEVSISQPPGSSVVLSDGVLAYKVDPYKKIKLPGAVDFDGSTSLQWVMVTGDLDSATSFSQYFSAPTTQARTALKAGSLSPGVTYKFRLTATSTSNSLIAGFADVVLQANAAPSGGVLIASAESATAVVDTLQLQSQGWMDIQSDLPLMFSFYVDTSGAVPSADQLLHRTAGSPIAPPSAVATAEIRMPASTGEDGLVTFIVYASDVWGASSARYVQVQSVSPVDEEASADELAEFMAGADEELDSAAAAADAESTALLCNSLANFVSKQSSRDLASGSGAPTAAQVQEREKRTELRASLLTRIAAVSSDSLDESGKAAVTESVLSITNEPTEISDEMETAALDVLSQLLSNSEGEGDEVASIPTSVGRKTFSTYGNLVRGRQLRSRVSRRMASRALSECGAAGSTTAFAASIMDGLAQIHRGSTIGLLPNEEPAVFTSGSVAGACGPFEDSAFGMTSSVQSCSEASSVSNADANMGVTEEQLALCLSEVAIFGSEGGDVPASGPRSASASILGDDLAMTCSADGVALKLLEFSAPPFCTDFSTLSSAEQYLGVTSGANSTAAFSSSSSDQLLSTAVHVSLNSGSDDISITEGGAITVALPLVAAPVINANAKFVLPATQRRLSGASYESVLLGSHAMTTVPGNVHAPVMSNRQEKLAALMARVDGNLWTGRRNLAVSAEHLGDFGGVFEVTCPTDMTNYVSGTYLETVSCPAGEHTVQCSAEQAGGVFSGECPVNAFTAGCANYDDTSAEWRGDACVVTELSNTHVTCACDSTGMFGARFASVTREASSTFTAAVVPDPTASPSPVAPSSSPASASSSPSAGPQVVDEPASNEEDSFGGKAIAGAVMVGVFALMALFAAYKYGQRQQAAAEAALAAEANNTAAYSTAEPVMATVPVSHDDITVSGVQVGQGQRNAGLDYYRSSAASRSVRLGAGASSNEQY